MVGGCGCGGLVGAWWRTEGDVYVLVCVCASVRACVCVYLRVCVCMVQRERGRGEWEEGWRRRVLGADVSFNFPPVFMKWLNRFWGVNHGFCGLCLCG